jgi:hypothetical protein
VTFSLRVDRTQFDSEYSVPYNLSASEQDSLCAQVERTYCWRGVRQIRLIRWPVRTRHGRVTDTYNHDFTCELVLEEEAGDGSLVVITAPAARTGGSSIKKIYKGHSQDPPPTLVVKCKETLSRDVTWLRSDAFTKISCGARLFKLQRFEIFLSNPLSARVSSVFRA